MSFVPPLFKNFGKNLKDFLEKKFDYNREIRVKTSTGNGVSFETSGRTQSKTGDYAGALLTTYKPKDVGTLELELDTEGKVKASVEADQLTKGLVLKLSRDQTNFGAVDVAYRREYFAVQDVLNVTKKNTTLEASAVAGYQGVSVGGAGKVDISANQFVDYNGGLEYSQPDYTLTVKTTESAEKLGLSYIHNLNQDLSVGASVVHNIAASQGAGTLVTGGFSYIFDRDTTLKTKVNSNAILSTAVEQRLYNPKLKFGLASEFNLRNQSAVPERYGISIGLGDI